MTRRPITKGTKVLRERVDHINARMEWVAYVKGNADVYVH